MTSLDHSLLEIPHELATRTSDQIEVALLWWEHEDRIAVAVVDRKANDSFLLDVDGRDALDVFMHPFLYAETAGVAA
jgi:hypothetical protein